MGKPRPIPLWAEDWLTSETIDAMSAKEERGYFRLLMHCWMGEQCSLPNDDRQLARWALLDVRTYRASILLRSCFVFHPILSGRLTNSKLYGLWVYETQIAKKASESGKAGAARRWARADGDPNGKKIASKPNQTITIKEEESQTRRRSKAPTPPPLDNWPGRKLTEEWGNENNIQPSRYPRWWEAFQSLEKAHGWAEVEALVSWIRRDDFWSRNCRSPLKLLKLDKDGTRYWDRLVDEMRRGRKGQTAMGFRPCPDAVGPYNG